MSALRCSALSISPKDCWSRAWIARLASRAARIAPVVLGAAAGPSLSSESRLCRILSV